MSFGNNIKIIRKEKGITQEQLADMLGVSRQAVSKWESDNGYPETDKLLALAKELGTSLDYLMNNETESVLKSDNYEDAKNELNSISKTSSADAVYELKYAAKMQDVHIEEKKNMVAVPSGKIAIKTFDNKNVVFCHSVRMSPIVFPKKDEPKYILNGIDKVTFWGEHSVILAWYANLEDIENEISEIAKAIQNGEIAYELKYYAELEDRTFGSPKLRNR